MVKSLSQLQGKKNCISNTNFIGSTHFRESKITCFVMMQFLVILYLCGGIKTKVKCKENKCNNQDGNMPQDIYHKKKYMHPFINSMSSALSW